MPRRVELPRRFGDGNEVLNLPARLCCASTLRRFQLQRPMRSREVVVLDVFQEDSSQMPRVERDDVVDALPPGQFDGMMRDCLSHADELKTDGFLLECGQ